MLFDTVEFLSPQSKIVNPVIEVTEAAPSPTEVAVTKQQFDTGLATKADAATTYSKTEVDSLVATLAFYDVGGFCTGKPEASSYLVRLVSPRAFTLPANLTGSVCKSGVASTGSSVLMIKKNGTSIGTITFAASSTTGTFSFASPVSFTSGDFLDIVAPGSQDATLADISVTLVGSIAVA